MWRSKGILGIIALFSLSIVAICNAPSAKATPFTFLQPGFTQEVYGVASHFMGGVAFAPDGDVWVNFCSFDGSPLTRFDRQTTVVVSGTTIHPESPGSPFPSNAGCGMTNHPDGTLYTNTSSGVINLDANTGAQLRPPFGSGGNALGIAPDPQTGNLVYVGSDGTILFVDVTFTTSGVFSTVTTGNFVDGIFFDPTGNFLFLANRSPQTRLTILDRSGNLVQHANMTTEPDGIAFHATTPKFVVTNNTDGSMTRFDFPGDDFTQVPVQSIFASGGFRGDLSQVGADGCLYLTQNGTRFDDGTLSSSNSVVRICGGFVPPPGVENCDNGIDDDGDGLVDCDDPDCTGNVACEVTAVTLVSFTAEPFNSGSVLLTWETATEVNNTGFNIYRGRTEGGEYTKINVMFIPAKGNATSGATYNYVDTPSSNGTYYYKLEDIDYSGVSAMHGPEKVRVKSGNSASHRSKKQKHK